MMVIQCKSDTEEHNNEKDKESIYEAYFEDYNVPNIKWGFINQKGRIIVPPKYDNVKSYKQQRAAVNLEGKWGFINSKGDEIIKAQYMKASSFYEGLANVRNFEGEIGFIDTNGIEIINSKYRTAGNFHNGLASIQQNGFWGFINKSGAIIIKSTYDQVWPFYNENISRVKIGNDYLLIDSLGNNRIINKSKIYAYSEGYYRFLENGLFGVYDSKFDLIIPPKYEYISSIKYGKVIIKKDNYWIVLDIKTGEEVGTHYNQITLIGPDHLRYEQGTHYGILNYRGDSLTKPIYDQINFYSCNRVIVSHLDSWKVLDTKGLAISNNSFALIWDYKEGLTQTINDSGIGYLDSNAHLVIPEIFLEAKEFSEGKAAIKLHD